MLCILSAVSLLLSTQQAVAATSGQVPVRAESRHGGSSHGTNFANVFSNGDPRQSMSQAWSQDSWGLLTFARSTPSRCWGADANVPYDVAVIGAPFDTATSFRPGARFGPNGIRQGARRIGIERINVPHKTRVSDFLDVVDCGDVPMVFVDNKVALRQLELANKDLLGHEAARSFAGQSLALDGKFHPRVLTLGGDHTITLPLLRGVAEIYGPVSVIHFDSHLDTWKPRNVTGGPWLPDEEVPVTHGSYFWYAAQEGLLAPNNSNIHVGIRGALGSWDDYENDWEVGFHISHAEDIEEVGYKGIVQKIRDVVGDNPVYITLDIDVIDPGMAPATGTPEIGGFTTREIKKILKGLDGLKIVGADIVEVAPDYDTQAELTQIAAANIGWDILALMAKTPLTV
ncbi:Arginase/deacetylase [Punctularia strigosozonata HHB-11173 SS5]|uniref:Arginase/deacetylase n=1 Tax=Punctularia strigosozonata (strain HHB-11173) TaxID=741275 RepID=UPI0004417FCA|nr:Arginase/deacetylase [Punctularia strigosozonata HHB-11173 SS5]EIN09871.1 Arginase/deacetylase [Punctularia strigosozonata HHB-11173 SS5]